MRSQKLLCVAGGSGLVGSSIVRAALNRGYKVNATMRDKDAAEKAPYLWALPGNEWLSLFNADMSDGSSFVQPLENADCIFIACLIPTYSGPDGTLAREMDQDQGYAEIISPTVNGCLNILRAANQQGIKKAVICSSTSSTNPVPNVEVKNEIDHWSDEVVQCELKKYTSAAKTVMEKEAMKFCEDHGIRLSVILPTGLYGPAVLPGHMKHNPFVWLQRVIKGGPARHEKTPNDSASMIHLHDLAALFLAAYENPNASGRYFGVYDSLHWQDIYAECQKILPDMQMPAPITEAAARPTGFDFSRRDSLGVAIRDFPTSLRQTIEWIKSDPFNSEKQ